MAGAGAGAQVTAEEDGGIGKGDVESDDGADDADDEGALADGPNDRRRGEINFRRVWETGRGGHFDSPFSEVLGAGAS